LVTTRELIHGAEHETHRDFLQVDIVDREGGAVVQVASQLGVPCLVVRAVSDVDERAEQAADWSTYVRAAAQNAAGIVLDIIATLEG
jgi:nucleoside phosphorylase